MHGHINKFGVMLVDTTIDCDVHGKQEAIIRMYQSTKEKGWNIKECVVCRENEAIPGAGAHRA